MPKKKSRKSNGQGGESETKSLRRKKQNRRRECLWKELCGEAVSHFKSMDYERAILHFNRALELNPFDKNALVARSKCHLLMGNAHLALKDAEQALAEDRNFIKGIYQKAEALYHLALFEYSLMYFHRGLHIRFQMENFRQGVLKAQQAILNTIGRTVPSFKRFSSQRKKEFCQQDYVKENDTSHKLGKQTGIPTDVKLLKGLQNDKQYLENLIHHPDVHDMSGNSKKENKIVTEAHEGMQFLEKRQNFWRQQQALIPVKAAQPKRYKTDSKYKTTCL